MDNELSRETIARRVAELAFASPTGAVSLAMDPERGVEGLDLMLIESVKRGRDEALELKMVDRVALLRLLLELTSPAENQGDKAGEFYGALEQAAGAIGGDEAAHEV